MPSSLFQGLHLPYMPMPRDLLKNRKGGGTFNQKVVLRLACALAHKCFVCVTLQVSGVAEGVLHAFLTWEAV